MSVTSGPGTAPAAPPPERAPSQHTGLDVTGFVLAFFFPLIGLILSWVGIVKAHREGRRASGLAVAGVVIGAVATVVTVIVVIVLVSAASRTGNAVNTGYDLYQSCVQAQKAGTMPPGFDCSQYLNGG